MLRSSLNILTLHVHILSMTTCLSNHQSEKIFLVFEKLYLPTTRCWETRYRDVYQIRFYLASGNALHCSPYWPRSLCLILSHCWQKKYFFICFMEKKKEGRHWTSIKCRVNSDELNSLLRLALIRGWGAQLYSVDDVQIYSDLSSHLSFNIISSTT